MTQSMPGQKIGLPLRLWLGAEVVFGLLSIATITIAPDRTAEQFAWPIKSVATAALLGGFYVAAGAFFVLALFARRWENIRVVVPAAILFTSAELLATFLHWDKFLVGTTPFYVWFASYLLPPPIFLGFYLWYQKRALPIPQQGDEPLAPGLRTVMQALGGLLALFAVAVFAVPSILIAIAPIAFTPLTARAFSGWVLAMGMMLLMAARENDRTRARLVSSFLIVALPAIGIQLARFPEGIDWSSPALYAAAALLAAVFAIGISLARGDWRRTLG